MDSGVALVIVDMQKGFITKENATLENSIDNLVTSNKFKCLVATQFINTQNSNFVKLLGWDEMHQGSESTNICSKIQKHDIQTIQKYTYGSTELISYLKNQDIRQALLVGLDTDACILKTALDIFDADIEPYVLAQYCGSSGGREYHDIAIKLLKRLIGEHNVITNSHKLINELKIKKQVSR